MTPHAPATPDLAAPASALTIRVLPPEEWSALLAIEPFASRGLPDDGSGDWAVLVVERLGADGRAQIVGTCSLFTAMHWDCWWLDPTEAGPARGVILRQLLREALSLLSEVGCAQVYTGAQADTPAVADLLERFGFQPSPGRLFVLQVADALARVVDQPGSPGSPAFRQSDVPPERGNGHSLDDQQKER